MRGTTDWIIYVFSLILPHVQLLTHFVVLLRYHHDFIQVALEIILDKLYDKMKPYRSCILNQCYPYYEFTSYTHTFHSFSPPSRSLVYTLSLPQRFDSAKSQQPLRPTKRVVIILV